MRTKLDKMKDLLKREPLARERANKHRAIAYFLKLHYPILENIPKKDLEDIIKLSESYDRSWRKITADNPSLRGSDYSRKTVLEQEKKLELGYGSNLYQDVIKN